MTVLEWLLAFELVPSIEGRDQCWASKSERRRQLQNRAWTITGFRITERRGFVDLMDPIDTIKPGPDDPLPDVLAEVTLARGAKGQRSFWYNRLLAEGLYSAWDEKLQKKYDRDRKVIA